MNTQVSRRKFLKIAGLGTISLPFAGLKWNRPEVCKDEVEYDDWKQYEVSIPVKYTGTELEFALYKADKAAQRRMKRFKDDMNKILFEGVSDSLRRMI